MMNYELMIWSSQCSTVAFSWTRGKGVHLYFHFLFRHYLLLLKRNKRHRLSCNLAELLQTYEARHESRAHPVCRRVASFISTAGLHSAKWLCSGRLGGARLTPRLPTLPTLCARWLGAQRSVPLPSAQAEQNYSYQPSDWPGGEAGDS